MDCTSNRMIVGSNDLEGSRNFIVIESTPPVKKIQDAAEELEKIVKRQSSPLVMESILKELDITNLLNESEQKEAFPYLLTAYKALDFINKSGILKGKINQSAVVKQSEINARCKGIAKELSTLYSFSSLADALMQKEDRANYILELNSGQNLEWISCAAHNKRKCIVTKNYIDNILSYLKNEKITQHLSVEDILKLKISVSWMQVNYLNAYQQKIDNSEHIFDLLQKMNALLSLTLSKPPDREFDGFKNSKILSKLALLKEQISSTVYFPNFWNDKSHFYELKECEKYIESCRAFIIDNDILNINGLTFLAKDVDNGLALYELSSEDDGQKTLVTFVYNHERMLHHYNFMQDRTSRQGMGGLCHAPVYNAIQPSKEALSKLIESKGYKDTKLKLITCGFGLDGAVAQVLSYMWAKDHSSCETRTYCFGVPSFLDANAAATLKAQDNHYAVNFELKGDNFLKSSIWSAFVAKPYSSDNFKSIYPLYNRDWFMSDVTGHDKEIYASQIKPGIEQPKKMYELYQEISNLITTAANSNPDDLGKNVAGIYKQDQKI